MAFNRALQLGVTVPGLDVLVRTVAVRQLPTPKLGDGSKWPWPSQLVRYFWGHLFGNIINPDAPGWLKSVDGMKFGADGRLYATVYGQKDVTVLNLDGTLADRIETDGLNPSNLAFGPAGTKSIFVTECEQGTIEIHPVGCDGLPLYY